MIIEVGKGKLFLHKLQQKNNELKLCSQEAYWAEKSLTYNLIMYVNILEIVFPFELVKRDMWKCHTSDKMLSNSLYPPP